jgi:hypothetical protein
MINMWAWIFNATLAISALLVCSSISIMNFMASEKDLTDERNDENKLRSQNIQAAEDEWDDDAEDVESGNRRRKSNKNSLAF